MAVKHGPYEEQMKDDSKQQRCGSGLYSVRQGRERRSKAATRNKDAG
jgi:hypothetical protein